MLECIDGFSDAAEGNDIFRTGPEASYFVGKLSGKRRERASRVLNDRFAVIYIAQITIGNRARFLKYLAAAARDAGYL